MKSKTSIHLKWGKVIKIELTSVEIFKVARTYPDSMTSKYNHIDWYEGFSTDYLSVKNPMTGLECKMVFAEYEREKSETSDDYDSVSEYIVELNTGKGYVFSCFKAISCNQIKLEKLRIEAENRFISWSSLIGVKLKRKQASHIYHQNNNR